MADINVNNRNPNDPNGVLSVKPLSDPGWISEDWTTFTRDPAKANGLRKVTVATLTLNDGRVFNAILDDASKQPISVIGDQKDIDTDQRTSWNSPSARAQRGESGSTTATATNTSTSYYWQDLGNGQRRLHKVTKDRNGTQIADDEASVKEEQDYLESEQRARNGGRSDEEIRKDKETKDREDRLSAERAAQTAETARHNQVSESDQATRTWLEQQKFQAGSTHTIGDRIYRIRPDGKAEDITPPGSSLKIPTFDPGTHVGIIQEAVAAKLKEIESNPQMTTQEKLKAAELITAQGKLLHDETTTVLSNQNTIRGQDITQRGQDMVQTAQRATLGNDIYQNAYKNSAAAAQYMPAGSDPGMGMIGQMLLNAGSIGAMGGSANAPQVPQGQAQQQLMGMGLPGMPSININLGGLTLPNNPSAQNVLDAAGKPGSPAPIAPTQPTPPGTFPDQPPTGEWPGPGSATYPHQTVPYSTQYNTDQPAPEFANSLLGQT